MKKLKLIVLFLILCNISFAQSTKKLLREIKGQWKVRNGNVTYVIFSEKEIQEGKEIFESVYKTENVNIDAIYYLEIKGDSIVLILTDYEIITEEYQDILYYIPKSFYITRISAKYPIGRKRFDKAAGKAFLETHKRVLELLENYK